MKRLMALLICMCLVMSFPSYANEVTWDNVQGNHNESVLLPEDVISSYDEYRTVARGDFLAAATTRISNGQDGSIGIEINTYAHHDVDRIFHSVFLDQWDEEDQDWYQVNSWDFVESKEDTSSGTIHLLLTEFSVTGYEVGKYYRVRGLHGVEYNDEVEATATETDGVLLTDRY